MNRMVLIAAAAMVVAAVIGAVIVGGGLVRPAPSPMPSPPSPAPSAVMASPGPLVERLGRFTEAQISLFGSALLADGRVLLVGGDDTTSGEVTVATAWLFDPWTKRIVPAGSMTKPRSAPVAVTLADGRVLIIGSWSADAARSAELYAPSAAAFVPTTDLPDLRTQCPCGALNVAPWIIVHASVLPDGRVFVAGGRGASKADVFSPVTAEWSQLEVGCNAERSVQTLLGDGRLLIVCVEKGERDTNGQTAVDLRARVFDPTTDDFTDVAPPPASVWAATPLHDGRILFTGNVPMLYDVARDAYTVIPLAPRGMGGTTGIDIGDGRVLFLGDPTSLIFDARSASFSEAGPGLTIADAVVRLADGRILTVGYQLDAKLIDPGRLP